jgi:hypothetical protein
MEIRRLDSPPSLRTLLVYTFHMEFKEPGRQVTLSGGETTPEADRFSEAELQVFNNLNPFVVLGGDGNKTFSEMKGLKNALLMKYHPDRNPRSSIICTRVAISINSAWEKIKDSYDGERFSGKLQEFENYLTPDEVKKEVESKIDIIIANPFQEVDTLDFIATFWGMKYPRDFSEMIRMLITSEKMRNHWKKQTQTYAETPSADGNKYVNAYAKIGIDLTKL